MQSINAHLDHPTGRKYDPKVDYFRRFAACRGSVNWDEYPIDQSNILQYLDAVQRFLWKRGERLWPTRPRRFVRGFSSDLAIRRTDPDPRSLFDKAAESYSSLPEFRTWLLDSSRAREPFWRESFLHRFMAPREHLPLVAQLKLIQYTIDDTNMLWPDAMPPVFLSRWLRLFLCDPNLRVHANLVAKFCDIVDKL
ncbi:hypothetical protein GGF31_007828 [Allomyces arbusculus]|nr:hypothetical protein GGF31_007828 [Allomyces arbusculus]